MLEIKLPIPKKYGAGTLTGLLIFWSMDYYSILSEQERKAVYLHEEGHAKAPLILFITSRILNLPWGKLKPFKLYRDSRFRKWIREKSVEWEAFADLNVLNNGVEAKFIVSSLKKLELGEEAFKFRMRAVKQAISVSRRAKQS